MESCPKPSQLVFESSDDLPEHYANPAGWQGIKFNSI